MESTKTTRSEQSAQKANRLDELRARIKRLDELDRHIGDLEDRFRKSCISVGSFNRLDLNGHMLNLNVHCKGLSQVREDALASGVSIVVIDKLLETPQVLGALMSQLETYERSYTGGIHGQVADSRAAVCTLRGELLDEAVTLLGVNPKKLKATPHHLRDALVLADWQKNYSIGLVLKRQRLSAAEESVLIRYGFTKESLANGQGNVIHAHLSRKQIAALTKPKHEFIESLSWCNGACHMKAYSHY